MGLCPSVPEESIHGNFHTSSAAYTNGVYDPVASAQRFVDIHGTTRQTQREEVSCGFGGQAVIAWRWWYDNIYHAPNQSDSYSKASANGVAYSPMVRSVHNGDKAVCNDTLKHNYSRTSRTEPPPTIPEHSSPDKAGGPRVKQWRRTERQRRQPIQNSYSEGIIRDYERQDVPEEFSKIYDTRQLIGVGTTAKVYLCVRRATDRKFACKVIDKRRLAFEPGQDQMLLDQLRKEIDILRSLDHPNIVRFEDVVETPSAIHVVMEMVTGGELFDYLLEYGAMAEVKAAHLMYGVMSAVAYMHKAGVVHRDIKAENLLLVDRSSEWPSAKLIDFGFSTKLKYTLTGSFLGTGGYIAPEIRQQRCYSQSVDVWACGVLLYLLNSGRLPFSADADVLPSGRQHAESRYALKFNEAQWAKRSPALRDLLRNMLDVDPMRRWSAAQVLRHPWITGLAFGMVFSPIRPKNGKNVGRRLSSDTNEVFRSCTPPNLALHRSISQEWAAPEARRGSAGNVNGGRWKRELVFSPAVLFLQSTGDLMTTSRTSIQRYGGFL